MKTIGSFATVFALCVGLAALPVSGQETGAKQDIKDAGSASAKAVKKTGSAIKKGTKKAVNKSAEGVEKGADKVKDKTQ